MEILAVASFLFEASSAASSASTSSSAACMAFSAPRFLFVLLLVLVWLPLIFLSRLFLVRAFVETVVSSPLFVLMTSSGVERAVCGVDQHLFELLMFLVDVDGRFKFQSDFVRHDGLKSGFLEVFFYLIILTVQPSSTIFLGRSGCFIILFFIPSIVRFSAYSGPIAAEYLLSSFNKSSLWKVRW